MENNINNKIKIHNFIIDIINYVFSNSFASLIFLGIFMYLAYNNKYERFEENMYEFGAIMFCFIFEIKQTLEDIKEKL